MQLEAFKRRKDRYFQKIPPFKYFYQIKPLRQYNYYFEKGDPFKLFNWPHFLVSCQPLYDIATNMTDIQKLLAQSNKFLS